MGIYQNSQQAFFQFDKTYSNRKTMEEQCAAGTDHIFVGRFVLVSYGASNFGTFIGYLHDGQVYIDIDHEHLYTYAVDMEHASNATDVYPGFVVKVFDDQEVFQYYRCTGYDTEDNSIPAWEIIQNNGGPSGEYLTNYEIDQNYYGNGFDKRGYDGTIWTKVFNEGQGRFVQVARMNGDTPRFDMVADPPASIPAAPYIGTEGAPDLYVIHTPSHWGFQIREVTESDGVYPLSDVMEGQKHLDIYMNLGGNNSAIEQRVYHSQETHPDTTTLNTITLTPDGQSGALYNGVAQNDLYQLGIHLPIIGNMIDEGYDLIYGYNIDNQTGERIEQRPCDIAWYSADSPTTLKTGGNPDLGGKTHDPATLAGNINNIHDLLGQIILELQNYPHTPEQFASLSPDLLYQYNNTYYRRGTILTPSLIDNSRYIFDRQTNVTEDDFKRNKYYVVKQSVTLPSESSEWTYNMFESSADSYDAAVAANNGYFLRNINFFRYEPITLTLFTAGDFYWKDGNNYYCDPGDSNGLPTYPNRTYYAIDITSNDVTAKNFLIGYSQANAQNFFVRDSDITYQAGDNIAYSPLDPNTIDSASLADNYYFLSGRSAILDGQELLFYYPGCYWYFDGTWHLGTEPAQLEGVDYFACTFASTPTYGIDANGTIQYYYEVTSREQVFFAALPAGIGISSLYIQYQNRYIPYDKIGELGVVNGKNPYTIPWVYYNLTMTTYTQDQVYFPNIYHAYDNTTHNLVIDQGPFRSTTSYYVINTAHEVENPFYLPNKYWYQDPLGSENYKLDDKNIMLDTQHYKKTSVFVYDDAEHECEYGYEWSDFAPYVPPSITLCTFVESATLIPLNELNKNTDTLYGLLLALNEIYGANDEATRNPQTVRGVYNALKDLFYQVKSLKPGYILYTNDFGQIESSSITIKQLQNLIHNS